MMKFQKIGTTLKFITFPAFIQPKHDGMRAYFIKDKKESYFLSRGSLKIPFVVDGSFPYGTFDGELLIPGLSRAEANGIFNSAFKKTKKMPTSFVFIIFDIPNKTKDTYKDKIVHLEGVFENKIFKHFEVIENETINNLQDLDYYKKRAIKEKKEGWIIRDKTMMWAATRTKYAAKVKITKEMTMRVVELIPGKGKHEGRLGAFVAQSIGLRSNIIAHIGTGFSDEERKDFGKNLKVGFLIEVEYKDKTATSLIEPRFKRIK